MECIRIAEGSYRAISGLPWQHRAGVRWPTLWDTFLSVLTLFIHRFKQSIHRCNPPSHRQSIALFPLSHSYKSVIPQPWLRYPTYITPLSRIPNSVFLVISRPHMAYYIQTQLVNHKSVKNRILQYKCLNKNIHNTWVHMHVHYEYTW